MIRRLAVPPLPRETAVGPEKALGAPAGPGTASGAQAALAGLHDPGEELQRAHLRLIRSARRGTETTANRVASYAHRMGLEDVQAFTSGLSESCYVEVHHAQASVKIRVSAHESRPTYNRLHGAADFEVALKGRVHQDADGGWVEAVRWLARRFQVPLPEGFEARVSAALKGEATRKANLAARWKAGEAERQACEAENRRHFEARSLGIKALAGLFKRSDEAYALGQTLPAVTSREGTKARARQEATFEAVASRIRDLGTFAPETLQELQRVDWADALERARQSRQAREGTHA